MSSKLRKKISGFRWNDGCFSDIELLLFGEVGNLGQFYILNDHLGCRYFLTFGGNQSFDHPEQTCCCSCFQHWTWSPCGNESSPVASHSPSVNSRQLSPNHGTILE